MSFSLKKSKINVMKTNLWDTCKKVVGQRPTNMFYFIIKNIMSQQGVSIVKSTTCLSGGTKTINFAGESTH